MGTVLTSSATLNCEHSFPVTPTTSSALTVQGSPVCVSGTFSPACTAPTSSSPPVKACTTITGSGGDATALTAGGSAVQLSSLTLTGDGKPGKPGTVTAESPAPLTAT